MGNNGEDIVVKIFKLPTLSLLHKSNIRIYRKKKLKNDVLFVEMKF